MPFLHQEKYFEGQNKIEMGLRKYNLKSPDCMVPVLAVINHY
jgi:hypothetical protein